MASLSFYAVCRELCVQTTDKAMLWCPIAPISRRTGIQAMALSVRKHRLLLAGWVVPVTGETMQAYRGEAAPRTCAQLSRARKPLQGNR